MHQTYHLICLNVLFIVNAAMYVEVLDKTELDLDEMKSWVIYLLFQRELFWNHLLLFLKSH